MELQIAFPSRYLKAVDLAGRQPAVVIRIVEARAMRVEGGKPVTKLVVHFVGKQKGLVLNKTNAIAIAELLGSTETDQFAKCSASTLRRHFGGKRAVLR